MGFTTTKPVLVIEGGLGSSSATVSFAPVCVGDSTPGSLQCAADGQSNSGYVLTSTGASSLPTWQAVASSGGTVVTHYTSGSGTHTFNASTKAVDLLMVGAGSGGGSGYQGASAASGGGSGSCAGSVIQNINIPIANFGATASYTVGAGGAGGAAVTTNNTVGNNGSVGGNTLFAGISCNGGSPGIG